MGIDGSYNRKPQHHNVAVFNTSKGPRDFRARGITLPTTDISHARCTTVAVTFRLGIFNRARISCYVPASLNSFVPPLVLYVSSPADPRPFLVDRVKSCCNVCEPSDDCVAVYAHPT